MRTRPTRANSLGSFLKQHRMRLDPMALGYSLARRRTPGLRREEVARRAAVSATWYTWLEQGRAATSSAAVLRRIAKALRLTDGERERLFVLAHQPSPAPRGRTASAISRHLQRVLDALEPSPAYLRTAAWDVVAWNRAAAQTIADFASLPHRQRNVLRLLFCDPLRKAQQADWDHLARFMAARLRAEIVEVGRPPDVSALISELGRSSRCFAALWRDKDVRQGRVEGPVYVRHPAGPRIALEYSSFAVDGRSDLTLCVYTPAAEADGRAIRQLLEGSE